MVAPPREADVVIVGGGAAGGTIAARLAEAGRNVAVFEAGPRWALSDLTSSQIWARRLKWGGAPVEVKSVQRAFTHNLATGWGLGGAALHHYATWPRFHDDVFQLKSRYGRGLDWPFEGAELRPWYDKVQAEIGLSGDASAEPWRPEGDPYPLPPQKLFAQAKLLKAGFDKLGLKTAPLPGAILTAEYKGRGACLYDGWCDAGCPIGALGNPLVTSIPRAEAAGAKFFTETQVVRVIPAGRDRAGGVEWVDAKGARGRTDGAQIVLAGSTVQNPRLMLASVAPEWPQGLGNDRGQVGRFFTLDALSLNFALFDVPTENHMGVSAGQLFSRKSFDERPDAPFGSWQWQIAPSLKPNDIFGIAPTRADLFGPPLHDFMRRAVKHMANMGALIGQLPDPACRITLSPEKDAHGMPLARIEHRFDEEMLKLWRYVTDEGQRILKAAGASESWTIPMQAGHPMGGTILGRDPAQSVAAADARVYDMTNVWLTGAGLFPQAGGTSPTFTVTALAERTAAAILAA